MKNNFLSVLRYSRVFSTARKPPDAPSISLCNTSREHFSAAVNQRAGAPIGLQAAQIIARSFYSHVTHVPDYFSEPAVKARLEKECIDLKFCCNQLTDDMSVFVDHLCRPELCLPYFKKIDAQIRNFVGPHSPIFAANHPSNLNDEDFVRTRLLPELRLITAHLCQSYAFNDAFLESFGGVIYYSTFINIPQNNMLLLDLGERGHGPIVHMIACCLLKELEYAGLIKNAKHTHALLGEPSTRVNRECCDYEPYYKFCLDDENASGLPNPTLMADYLMQLTVLPSISRLVKLCEKYAALLSYSVSTEHKILSRNGALASQPVLEGLEKGQWTIRSAKKVLAGMTP